MSWATPRRNQKPRSGWTRAAVLRKQAFEQSNFTGWKFYLHTTASRARGLTSFRFFSYFIRPSSSLRYSLFSQADPSPFPTLSSSGDRLCCPSLPQPLAGRSVTLVRGGFFSLRHNSDTNFALVKFVIDKRLSRNLLWHPGLWWPYTQCRWLSTFRRNMLPLYLW